MDFNVVFWEKWRPSHPPINAGREIMDVCTKAGVHFLSADLQRLITRSRDAQRNINHEICQRIAGELKCAACYFNFNIQKTPAQQSATSQPVNSLYLLSHKPGDSRLILIRIRLDKRIKAALWFHAVVSVTSAALGKTL